MSGSRKHWLRDKGFVRISVGVLLVVMVGLLLPMDSALAQPAITSVQPSGGPLNGGTPVTITGTGFVDGVTVTFGGDDASAVFVNSTTLTCTSPGPKPAGPVDVVVTNPDTQTTTLTGGFTYAPGPNLTVVDPAAGPLAGGTSVTITGTDFVDGAVVSFGGVAATTTFVDGTTLTCTTPAGVSAGTVDVVVTNPDTQSDTLADGFQYLVPPTITGISPAMGPLAGGTAVTIVGTNFAPGMTVTFGGSDAAAVFVNETTLTCTSPGPMPEGAVDVVVSNLAGETATAAGGFRYNPAPTISAITPSAGSINGTTTVVITGMNFLSGATVTFDGTTANTITVDSATQITCTPLPHAVATVDVVVTNPDGQQAIQANGYTYALAPSITSISPSGGSISGGTSVTLTGSDFQNGATVSFGGTPAVSVTVNSSNEIVCVTDAHDPGAVDVTVTNPDGQTGTVAGGYTYDEAPIITSISPTGGSSAGGTAVTITGQGFNNGATVTFDGSDAAAVFVDAFTLTCTSPAHANGAVAVVVTNPDGQTATQANGFTYADPPTITTISPDRGDVGGGETVTITGTGFQNGAGVTFGGETAATVFVNNTTLTCTTPAHAQGSVDVVVTNPDSQSVTSAGGFTYANAPKVTSVTPGSGSEAGGTTVVLTGANFAAGATVTFGTDSATGVVVDSDSQITCVTPAHAAGAVDVTVTNTDTLSGTLANGYTYGPGPSIASISPSGGNINGNTQVTINGMNFAQGATVTFGGDAATGIVVVSSTQITCVTPAHAAGAVDVVVTNPDTQSVTLANGYTYSPAPAITSISPTGGSVNGGTVVTITGTGFINGATVTFGLASATVTVDSDTQITCTTPAHLAGVVDVVVTNPDQQSATSSAAYTYAAAPTISAVTPAQGSTSGNDTITVTGSGFVNGAVVNIGGTDATTTFVDVNTLSCITPAHAAGAVDVIVTNPDAQADTLANGYTYAAAPTITSVSPASGTTNGGETITLTGSGFVDGIVATFDGLDAKAVFVSASTVTCTAPAHPTPGTVDVVVRNPDNQTATRTNGYNYNSAPAPTVSNLNPGTGPSNGGQTVVITGTGFAQSATVSFGGTLAPSVTVDSATQITCVTPSNVAGPVDVVVTNPDTQSVTVGGGYTYTADPAPTVGAISPNSGPSNGGTLVTVTGTGYVTGAVVSFDGVPATDNQVISALQINCRTPVHAPATVTVTVTNPDTQTGDLVNGFTYNASPTPSIISVAPVSGSTFGGETVTITGSNFASDATVTFDGIAAGITSITDTTIVCTTPAHAAGAVSVVVTNPDGQTATAGSGYTYVDPPVISDVSPAQGTTAGATPITITGSNFVTGATVTIGGTAAGNVVVAGPTQITCTTPAHGAGSVDVVVTNPDSQAGTLANGYTYVNPPTISALTPTSGSANGGTQVSITGTDFRAGATVAFGGVSATGVTVITSTQIICTTPAHAAGSVDVVVTNSDGTSATSSGAFTFVAPPVLTSVSPAQGPVNTATPVVLTGSDFVAGATVTFGGIAATSVTVDSATQISCTTPAMPAGSVDVKVTNPDGQSTTLAGGYTYANAPTISSIAPTSGPLAGGTAVTVTGTNFVSGTTVTFGGQSGAAVFVDATTLTCTTPPGTAAGAVDVVVTNPDGQSATLANGFNYLVSPVITAISPNMGPLAGGTTVTITGSNFAPDTTVTFGGDDAAAVFVNATTLTCTSPGPKPSGSVDVVVTNSDGQSATQPNGFTYLPAPTVLEVTPAGGSINGGTLVTLSGTNFLDGATVSFGNTPADTVTFVDIYTLTCITQARAAGVVDVVVTNPDGQTATLANGYTYAPDPVISAISPLGGPPEGGTTVTITGSNFVDGSVVSFDGVDANTVFVDTTTLTCTTPAHANGFVDVAVTSPSGQAVIQANGFQYWPPPEITVISPAIGTEAGGESITIIGSNFQDGVTVTLGGVDAGAVFVDNATITCTAPAHAAGVVDVVVTNVDSQSATLTNGYTYAAPPTVTSVDPALGATIGGTTVTVTGTNFQLGARVTFDGLNANVTFVDATTLTCTTPAHAAGAVDVVVINPDNQSATGAGLFTYAAAPTLSAITPNAGSEAGGTAVTISGANFVNGATVTFDGLDAGATFVDANTLTCTAPAHAAGSVDVVVTNPDTLSATWAGGYTYGVAPTVAAISPTGGSINGGTTVTITGTNFAGGATVTFDGTTATNILVVSSTTITCQTPTHAAGVVDVVVTNPDGQSATLAGSYTYAGAPAFTAVTPNSGSTAGGDTVSVTGTNFVDGATVDFGGAPATVTFVNAGELTCVTPAHLPGAVDITITNPDGQEVVANSAYTYVLTPTLSQINPASGPTAGGNTVVITGADFVDGATVTFDGVNATVVFVNSGRLDVTVPIHAAGAVDVVVSNPGGQSDTLAGGYTYVPAPSITSVSPVGGTSNGGITVTITGSHFIDGAKVTFDGVDANGVFVSDTQMTCTAPPHAAGLATVVVTNPDGQVSNSRTFNYTTAPAPTVTSLSPNSGPSNGAQTVIITGTNFAAGATVTFAGLASPSVTVDSATQITCVTPAHAAGSVDVVVTNPDGKTAVVGGGYTYTASPAPALWTISPATGNSNGNTLVTLTGNNFDPNATVSFGGSVATNVTVISALQINCATPGHPAGTVDVVVTNPDGQSATLTAAFTYTADPAPTVTSIDPAVGPSDGGNTVTITGTDFVTGVTVTFGTTAGQVTSSTATEIQCTVPAGASGTVDVIVTNPDGQSATLAGAYTYLLPLTVTGISPTQGSTIGGETVVITGTNLASGASVTFDGVACPTVTVDSDTQITCLTPAHGAGLVDVTVINPDNRSVTLIKAFEFIPPPTITSVTPNQGSTNGGDDVIITGTDFQNGATVAFDGVSATSVTVVSSTRITCTTPAHVAGAVDVVVTNPDTQSGTLTGGFSFGSAPVIGSILPASGPVSGGNSVTINGNNFQAGASVTFRGVASGTVTVASATQIVCTAPPNTQGPADVTVINPDDQSVTRVDGYTYEPGPEVTNVTPAQGPTTGGTSVTVNGAGFVSGAAVAFGGVQASGVAVASGIQLSCVTPGHPTPGTVDVSVTNPDGQTGTLAMSFLYTQAPAPAVTSVSPLTGTANGGTLVTITGSDFATGATVTFGGVAATQVTVVSGTEITCTAPAHALGTVDVTVINPDGQQATRFSAFTYTPAPAPGVTSVNPNIGPASGGTSVTIAGLNFADGATVTFGGTAATNVVVVSSTTITCVTPVHAGGVVDVVITNPDTQSGTLTNGFSYTQGPPPDVTAVTPTIGPIAGGFTATLTGTGFVSGATVTFGGTAATNVVVGSATSITCTVPAHAAGQVDVVVRNPDTQFDTLANGFTYTADPPPDITSISPTSGTASGGTTITITGTGFVNGATVRIGGVSATNVVVASTTSITCVTPAGNAGPADVVVQNPDTQFDVLTGGFTYIALPPSIDGVVPNSGPTSGGQSVTITGTNFSTGAKVSFGGINVSAMRINSNTLVVTTPSHAEGAVDVKVTNSDGQSDTMTAGFTYTPVVGVAVLSIFPDVGSENGGDTVTITGSGFQSGATVTFGGNAATTVFVNDTTLTCTTPAHASGPVNVVVTNPDNNSDTVTDGFTYVPDPMHFQTVTGSDTACIYAGTAILDGISLATNDEVAVFVSDGQGGELLVGSCVFGQVNPDEYYVVINGDDPATVEKDGAEDGDTLIFRIWDENTDTELTVDPVDMATQTRDGFTRPSVPPVFSPGVRFAMLNLDVSTTAPIVTAIDPVSGTADGGDTVTITGSNFVTGAMVTFNNEEVTAEVVDDTTLTCMTPAHAVGIVDVTVTNPDGQSGTLADGFTFLGPLPYISQLEPDAGDPAGGETITISGIHFINGATVTFDGVDASAVFISDTTLTCTAPAHDPAVVLVQVINPDGQVGRALYTYGNLTGVPPSAGFQADPVAGSAPLTVFFTDESIGNITGRLWDFGDGTTSVDVDPQHQYDATGTYTISLSVYGPGGLNTLTRTDYIVVGELLKAGFTYSPESGQAPLNVMFTDTSTGIIDTWTWDFGDGAVSNDPNPTHQYETAGTYTVQLEISGPDGISRASAQIVVSPPAVEAPSADFSANPVQGDVPLQVSFSNLSSGTDLTYLWDFGDGNTSTQTHPIHQYETAGTYTVSLTASNSAGSDTATRENYITVDALEPENNPPTQPELIDPVDGLVDVSLVAQLRCGPFQDPDGDDYHYMSEFQISPVADFSIMTLNWVSTTNLTMFTIPDFILHGGVRYYWRARYGDNRSAWSSWAPAYSFVTMTGTDVDDLDNNGIPDSQEVDDPETYFPDLAIQQGSWMFVRSMVGNVVIGIEAVSGVDALVSFMAIHPDQVPVPAGIQMPFGLVAFNLKTHEPGGTARIRIHFSEDLLPDARWYHYHQVRQQFNQFAVLESDNRSMLLEIIDGGDGDIDGLENGWINTPAGYGVTEQPCEAVALFTSTYAKEDPMTVEFDASASVGTILLDYGDGSEPASTAVSTHTYTSGGFFTVTLTVTDDTGCTATATKTIEIPEPRGGHLCFIGQAGQAGGWSLWYMSMVLGLILMVAVLAGYGIHRRQEKCDGDMP